VDESLVWVQNCQFYLLLRCLARLCLKTRLEGTQLFVVGVELHGEVQGLEHGCLSLCKLLQAKLALHQHIKLSNSEWVYLVELGADQQKSASHQLPSVLVEAQASLKESVEKAEGEEESAPAEVKIMLRAVEPMDAF
jgi:hypothetical protein